MEAGEILADWLKSHDYGGLVNGYLGCGCALDELHPCDSVDLGECQAAYKWPCDIDKCENEDCATREYPEFRDWCMRPEKPPVVEDTLGGGESE